MKESELVLLLGQAEHARNHAYAPYSKFSVGAALLAASGRTFTGCNVENLSFGLTICAERAAVCNAITVGERNFTGLVVVADSVEPVTLCGACRQVLAEFNPDLDICSSTMSGVRFRSRLSVLLPRPSAGILEV